MDTLDSLFSTRAIQNADQDFIYRLTTRGIEHRSLSYSDFYNICLSKIETWNKFNCSPKGVVAIYAENSVEYTIALCSAIFSDFIPLLLSLKLPIQQLKAILAETSCKIGVCSLPQSEMKNLKTNTKINWKSIEEFSHNGVIESENKHLEYKIKKNPNEIALIMHTSGSTSGPKLVPLTHTQILKNQQSVDEVLGSSWTAKKRSLCWLPLYHGFALLSEFFRHAYAGASLVIHQKPNKTAMDLLQSMQAAKTDIFCAVPWIYENIAQIIKEEEDVGENATSLSRKILQQNSILFTGGAPLDPELEQFFSSRQIRITSIFGLTESAGSVMFGQGAPPLFYPIRSLGSQFIERDHSTYELCFEDGPSTIASYYCKNKAERNKQKNPAKKKFFPTGDLFVKNKDRWSFIGRRNDLFKNKMGVIVNPLAFEQEVDQLAAVKKSCFIGKNLDLNYLFVQLKKKEIEANSDQLLEHKIKALNGKLGPANKIFSQNVRFLDPDIDLPLTQKGNLRRSLVDKNFQTYLKYSRKIKTSKIEPLILRSGEPIQHEQVKEFICRSIQSLLDSDRSIDLKLSLIELGLDSLAIIGLNRQIADLFDLSLKLDTLFNCANIKTLIELVYHEMQIRNGLHGGINKTSQSAVTREPVKPMSYETQYLLNSFQYFQKFASKKYSPFPFRPESLLLQCPKIFSHAELRKALTIIEGIHPILKTVLDAKKDVFFISAESMIEKSLASSLTLASKDQLPDCIRSNVSQKLDLYSGPLYKIVPIKMTQQSQDQNSPFYLLIVMHHIICDYLSTVIFANALQEVLTHPDKKYEQLNYKKEFLTRHRPSFSIPNKPNSFWSKNFSNLISPSISSSPRPMLKNQPALQGINAPFTLQGIDPSQLHQHLAKNNLTVFTALLGSWMYALFKDSDDPAWSMTPLSQRFSPSNEGLLGPYLQLAVIPASFHKGMQLRDFLCELQQNIAKAYKYLESMPFSLLHNFRLPSQAQKQTFLQNALLYRSPSEKFNLDQAWSCERTEPFCNWSRFSIYLDLYYDKNNNFCGHLGYQKEMFSKEKIDGIKSNFVKLLKRVLTDLDSSL